MSNNEFRITDLLVQRDGRVWLIPDRQGDRKVTSVPIQMGTVEKNPRTRKPEWRFKCADCKPFWGPVRRTRREAILDLTEHWNEER